MTAINLCPINAKNMGDAREWALCNYFGCTRCKHDKTPYDQGSDISVNGMDISVKSSAFTLMAGNLCEGRETFDGIWSLYAERVHSNTFAYITTDFTAYIMNIDEFCQFVYNFCYIERDSEKNGGKMKIRCKKESQKMRKWLAAVA